MLTPFHPKGSGTVVLGIVSALVLQSAVLEKLPYDIKKRIENICDIIAFLLIPAACIAVFVWLMHL